MESSHASAWIIHIGACYDPDLRSEVTLSATIQQTCIHSVWKARDSFPEKFQNGPPNTWYMQVKDTRFIKITGRLLTPVCRALVCTEVKALHPSQPSCCIVIHVFEIDITAWNAHCVLCLHIVPQGCLALHAPRGRTGELHSGWCRDVWKASNCSSHVKDES
jgi:hypothetical protein